MAKQKKWWYVLVFTPSGAKYVTGIFDHKMAEWKESDKPQELSESWARDICAGLLWNGYNATVVCSPIELDRQPYNYGEYKCQFVPKGDNND